MSDEPIFAYFPVFAARRADDVGDLGSAVQEAENLFKEWADRVHVRGSYTTVGMRPDADLMMWWVSNSVEDTQQLLAQFRRSAAGRALDLTHAFLGVHRPPEVARDHQPAFVKGVPPKRYLNVYPFVRTPEWYLLPREERAELLREHGEMGREFPGVLANTTSAFGLGDWEWILAFEADDVIEIVDCIRRLRDSRARLYTKVEVPFVTGVRKDLGEVIRDVL